MRMFREIGREVREDDELREVRIPTWNDYNVKHRVIEQHLNTARVWTEQESINNINQLLAELHQNDNKEC